MANHVRQQIRDHVVSLLTGLTTTGGNIFASRVFPMHDENIPGLIVYTLDEEDERSSMGDKVDRMLDVMVEGYDMVIAGLDDDLDTISKEVEKAIFADEKLGGFSLNTELSKTEIDLGSSAEKKVGKLTLIFKVWYRTTQAEPDVSLS